MLRRFLIASCLALALGCSHVDTGQIDYRVAENPGTNEHCPNDRICHLGELNRRYAQHGAPAFTLPAQPAAAATAVATPPDAASASANPPAPPTTNSAAAQIQVTAAPAAAPPIQAGSIFSINLEQVIVGGTLLEGMVFGQELGRTAEIVILANVFELGSAADSPTRFLESFEYMPASGAAPANQLKVVHFAADVRRNQPLNFSNIPLLTARRYEGRSVGIQIVILEVDVRSSSLSNMLGTLADMGRGALPIPPGAHQLLNNLGQSLFSGRGDDTLFDYRFVLSPASTQGDSMQPILAPGRYVVRRRQDRATPMAWNDVRLDHNSARLYRQVGGQWVEAREDLYLVLNIQQLPGHYPREFYNMQTWQAARQALQDAADDPTAPVNVLSQNFGEVVAGQRSMASRDQLVGLWRDALARLRDYERHVTLTADRQVYAGCTVLPTENRNPAPGLARRDALDALDIVLSEYRRLHALPQDGGVLPFREQERAEIVSAIARYVIPYPEGYAARFETRIAFEEAYIAAAKAQAFVSDMLSRAELRMPRAANCDEAVRAGLAARS